VAVSLKFISGNALPIDFLFLNGRFMAMAATKRHDNYIDEDVSKKRKLMFCLTV
jgi:hypothetical protein